MNQKSIFAVREWNFAKLLLLGSGCFALAAVGFFVAVLLQRNQFMNTSKDATSDISIAEKTRIVDSLNASSTNADQNTATAKISSTQADASDTKAAAKLRILNALNAQ